MIYQEAMSFAGLGLYKYKFDGTIEFMDMKTLQIFDILDVYPEPHMITGKKIFELIYTENEDTIYKKLRTSGQLRDFKYSFKTLKGVNKCLNHDSYIIYGKKNGEESIQVIIRDITEQEQSEKLLCYSHAKYEAMIEAFDGLIYMCSRDYKVEFMNKRFIERTGYDPIGKNCYRVIHNLEKICPWCINERVFHGETVKWEVFSPKDKKWYYVVNTPLRHPDGQVSKMAMIQDVTEGKIAQELLAAEKERLTVTLRSIGDGVITTDRDGKIIFINKMGENLTGWTQEEAKGKPLTDIFIIIDEKTRQLRKNPLEIVIETRGTAGLAENTLLIAKDGTEKPIADSGAPIFDRESKIVGIVIVFRNISEQKKLEEESLKASKIESLEILSGGIAHDFNNILTGIMGNISLAKMYATPKDEIYKILVEAENASYRAKDLTQQLLTFSKSGTPIKQIASITDLVKDSSYFILRGSNVSCKFFIPDDLYTVEIDQGQISQVINNLIINAKQSMPEGGMIEVSAENLTVNDEKQLPLKKGKYVKFSIKDNGNGISKENLPRIFDPYFTTKKRGSGLGLTNSYSIVKKHDGYLTVESKPCLGTTFYIYLPASKEKIHKRKKDKTFRGEGRILLMDDEDIILKVTGEILHRLGYEVEFARNGGEVIEIYKKSKNSPHPFDVIIMDLTIPGGMGGKETMQKLIEIDPEVKAIASSGYSNDLVMAEFRKYGFCGVMAKPYKISDLSKTLHKIIME